MEVNEAQKTVLFDPIRQRFSGNLNGVRIGLWGLAFKPETDDIREAPALYMIEKLLEAGATVCAFDPEAMDNVKGRLGDRIAFADNPYAAIEGADALLICTEWQVFRTPDFDRMKGPQPAGYLRWPQPLRCRRRSGAWNTSIGRRATAG